MGPKTKPEKRRHLRDASAIHGVAKQAAAGGGFGAPSLPQCLFQKILIALGSSGLPSRASPRC